MSSVTVKYDLSDKAMREHFIATGEQAKRTHALTIDCTAIAPEERALVLDWTREFIGGEICTVVESGTYTHHRDLHLDKEPTGTEVLGHMRRMLAELAEAKQVIKANEARRKAEGDAEAARKKRWEQEEEEARVSKIAERKAWIAEHGSRHLQRATGEGYDCTRLYLTERAAIEYPGWVLDFDDTASWGNRSCPTPKALDLLDAATEGKTTIVESKVVWLKAEPTNHRHDPAPEEEAALALYDAECFEPCEALAIRDMNYGEGRWLVRIV